MMPQRYLGDAVYAELQPSGMIRLYTTDGITIQNEIFIEPEVYCSLEEFVGTVLRVQYPLQWGKR